MLLKGLKKPMVDSLDIVHSQRHVLCSICQPRDLCLAAKLQETNLRVNANGVGVGARKGDEKVTRARGVAPGLINMSDRGIVLPSDRDSGSFWSVWGGV